MELIDERLSDERNNKYRLRIVYFLMPTFFSFALFPVLSYLFVWYEVRDQVKKAIK